jgi:hypothetical protein
MYVPVLWLRVQWVQLAVYANRQWHIFSYPIRKVDHGS